MPLTLRNLFQAVLILVCLFMISTLALAAPLAEPSNLGLNKIDLQRYHDSGKYDADIASAIREAQYYLRFRINQNKHPKNPDKLAIVIDIDETALSNYEDIKRYQFGGTREEVDAAEADGHDPAIPPTLSLFNYAKSHGVAVFFISGRKQYEKASTEKNLNNTGYHDWDGMLLEPNDYNKDSAAPFKVASRKKITEMGYDIVLNVGDQFSDLKGGYADMSIKLPNPYYFTN